MGSTFSIALYAASPPQADAAATAVFAELRRLDRMLSNHGPDSEWSGVNRHAAERAVQVTQELFDLISACLEYSRSSEGAFDITVGPLIRAWGLFDGPGRLTDGASIKEALASAGYRHILLDPIGRAVRLAGPGVKMDPGGIGKGYAVDCMIGALRRKGIERALIPAVRSSIYAVCRRVTRDGRTAFAARAAEMA